jgi:hypothetical protein
MAADIASGLIRARLTTQERDVITGAGERDLIKPEDLVKFAESVREFRDVFGGDFTANASKLIQAGQVSTLDIGHLATRAKERGMGGDQFLAAALAILQTAPNQRAAATQVSEFFDGKLKLDTRQQQVFNEQLALIQTAPQRNVIGRSFVSTDPQLRAADILQNVQGQRAIVEQAAQAEQETLLQIIKESRKRAYSDYNVVDRFGKTLADFIYLGGADVLGAEDAAIRAAAYSPNYAGLNDEERKLMLDYLRRTADGVEGATISPPKPSGRQQN